MAKIKGPVFNNLSGRIGNMVIYQLNGKTVARAISALPAKPAIGRQLIARQRFGRISSIMVATHEMVSVGFGREDAERTPRQYACSCNVKLFHKELSERTEPCYPDMQFSQGNLSNVTDAHCTMNATNEFTLTWEGFEADKPHHDTDSLMFMFICFDDLQKVKVFRSINRSAGMATGTLPASFTGSSLHLYMAFHNHQYKTNDFASNTRYVPIQ